MALRRYRYRAYPTPGQVRMLARTFGCCRVVFNDFIAERDRLYRAGRHHEVSFSETAKAVTTVAKATTERAWLGEVSASPGHHRRRRRARAGLARSTASAGLRLHRRAVLRPSYPIETERLLLRPFEPGDYDALYAIHSRADVLPARPNCT